LPIWPIVCHVNSPSPFFPSPHRSYLGPESIWCFSLRDVEDFSYTAFFPPPFFSLHRGVRPSFPFEKNCVTSPPNGMGTIVTYVWYFSSFFFGNPRLKGLLPLYHVAEDEVYTRFPPFFCLVWRCYFFPLPPPLLLRSLGTPGENSFPPPFFCVFEPSSNSSSKKSKWIITFDFLPPLFPPNPAFLPHVHASFLPFFFPVPGRFDKAFFLSA